MSPRSSDNDSKSSGSAAPDIYVGLLSVAVLALGLGCLFLAMELQEYGWQLAP